MQPAVVLDEGLELHRDYWEARLAGKYRQCGVPTDFPRRGEYGRPRRHFVCEVAETNCRRIRSVCGQSDALLFTLLMASLKTCLRLYSGHDDIRVGTVIRQRDADTSGYNRILVTRDIAHGDLSFQAFSAKVKQTLAEAYEHQVYPFNKLAGLLNLESLDGCCSLFDVAMALDSIHVPEHLEETQADVLVLWSSRPETLRCSIAYHPELMLESTIERFARHYLKVLGEGVHNPAIPLRKFTLIDLEEKHRILDEWNQTERAYPQACVHELFENQARQTPLAPALDCGGGLQLTYSALNERANQVAHYLRRKGAGPEVRVAICADHSVELISGLLGIMKAGAAYVPLDPSFSTERQQLMIEGAGATILVTEDVLSGRAAEGDDRIADQDISDPPRTSTPQNLAYILYTSGSTGRPKAVGIENQSLTNYLCWARESYVTEGIQAHFPLYSSIAFDLTVTSIFTPLISGGCVHVYSRREETETLIKKVVEAGECDSVKLTPSHLGILDPIRNGRMQQLIVGGEALTSQIVRRTVQQAAAPLIVWNEYGPTEGTVACMLHQYQPEKDDIRSHVPIGRPGGNAKMYILDEQMNTMPVGLEGEIFIGGPGLARGYLNSAKLTAERFVPNCFSKRDGERLYRTGDRGRYLEDGTVEYLGRRDEQVKFHGYRVELNEIRTALNRFPAIQDSVIRVERYGEEQSLIVAYYVSRQPLEADEMRSFLRRTLIPEVTPSLFVHLPRLPLTMNGKVNYVALREAMTAGREVAEGRKIVEPQTPMEEILADIWAEGLGVSRVGRQDNFFELGGHSLGAIRLAGRIKQVLGLDVPIRELFDAPSVAGLADYLRRSTSAGGQFLESIVPAPRTEDMPLSYGQQQLWVVNQLNPGSAAYHLASSFHFRGPLEPPILERTVSEIVRRHEVLRTTFPSRDGVPVQHIAAPRRIIFPQIDLSDLQLDERLAELDRLQQQNATQSFDLAHGPLIRFSLVRFEAEHHILLVGLHHIIADRWSIQIFVREATEIYAALFGDKPIPFPDLPVQYADYAYWCHNQMKSAAFLQSVEYWRRQLADPPTLKLSCDGISQTSASSGALLDTVIPAKVIQKIRELSRQQGCTLFMSLLSVWQLLLGRYCDQTDILVGTPVANRPAPELYSLIGFMVNTVVLRTDLSGDPSFIELLQRVRTVVLDANLHQQVPFEYLVSELNPPREPGQTPFFRCLFNFDRHEPFSCALPQLRIEPQASPLITPKFDLEVYAVERLEDVALTLVYRPHLFSEALVRRLLDHYLVLLRTFAEQPGSKVWDANLGAPRAEAPPSPESAQCAHERFEVQAERTPNAVAITHGVHSWTYGQLNAAANRIARLLVTRGIGLDTPVGLCMEPSAELVVGILAILKAGGSYVPLDPINPRERLGFMARAASLSAILSHTSCCEMLPETQCSTIFIDKEAILFSSADEPNLGIHVPGTCAAYVIFTSGSTGHPKGVVIPHSNITSLFDGTNGWYGFNSDDVWTLFHSFGFDVSVWEMWGALLHGGRLVIVPPLIKHDPDALYRLLAAEDVTVLCQTPSAFHRLAACQAAQMDSILSSLRLVIMAGERLNPASLRNWTKLYGVAKPELINMYGITETTVHSTYRRILEADVEVGKTSPIGRAIPGTRIHIVGDAGRLTPQGVKGEIYVGGGQVARGYLGKPRLTAERFLPDPFGDKGQRFYKSGDTARCLIADDLEYLGRRDDQIKIRGYRVERGEIEALLTCYPGVTSVAVKLWRDPAGQDHLVAYMVGAAKNLTARQLRNDLASSLPEYMIPSHVVHLSHAPLTSNGKIDTRNLPSPQVPSYASANQAGPSTAMEEIVLDVWRQILVNEAIGLDDNFFEVGGNSFLLIQARQKLSDRTGINISITDMLRFATARGLAQSLQEAP